MWCAYDKFNRRYDASSIHLHALLGVGNFTKVVRVCANRVWCGPRLPEIWEILAYTIDYFNLLKPNGTYMYQLLQQ
jgi:hypothetical protein